MPASPKLLDQVCETLRIPHGSTRTERAALDWIKRFILHCDKCHSAEMGTEVFGSLP
ncbi:phage integrase N-terminal SAM-like domain-containing protein [Rugosibacter aromaticivorans]|uniref:phage integrase N-terminal SAM-like domain-containing protein n=1 Tax=Rugosibacter aromaticivorans TaxID=1565605 RepID=UPI0032B00785